MIEIVSFASTLANTGKHRVTAVLFGNIVDELHERYGLAHTGTTEQTNLAALGNWHDQVDYLDARFQNLGRHCLLFETWRLTVNRHQFFCANVACIINRLAEYIHDPAQRLLADRYHDRAARIGDRHATLQAF